jgi:hypothetical protein
MGIKKNKEHYYRRHSAMKMIVDVNAPWSIFLSFSFRFPRPSLGKILFQRNEAFIRAFTNLTSLLRFSSRISISFHVRAWYITLLLL